MKVTRDGLYSIGTYSFFLTDIPLHIRQDANPWGRLLRAKWTGEKRMVKKGEWYLSGAIIEAHLAKNDLEFEHCIAKLVRIKIIEVIDKEYD